MGAASVPTAVAASRHTNRAVAIVRVCSVERTAAGAAPISSAGVHRQRYAQRTNMAPATEVGDASRMGDSVHETTVTCELRQIRRHLVFRPTEEARDRFLPPSPPPLSLPFPPLLTSAERPHIRQRRVQHRGRIRSLSDFSEDGAIALKILRWRIAKADPRQKPTQRNPTARNICKLNKPNIYKLIFKVFYRCLRSNRVEAGFARQKFLFLRRVLSAERKRFATQLMH
jgi:hypothetical protein